MDLDTCYLARHRNCMHQRWVFGALNSAASANAVKLYGGDWTGSAHFCLLFGVFCPFLSTSLYLLLLLLLLLLLPSLYTHISHIVGLHMCIYARTYSHTYIHTYLCIHVCDIFMYIYIYVCIYSINIYIYIHRDRFCGTMTKKSLPGLARRPVHQSDPPPARDQPGASAPPASIL